MASTFRQVGGAIGVALLGGIYLNAYVAKLHLPPGLPAPLAGQARGQAHAAFMSGLDRTLLLAAGVAAVAAGLVAAFLPGRKPAAQAPEPAMPGAGRDRPGPGPA